MNTDIEVWKDIPNYEGLYQASTLGRIKSLGNNFSRKEKILKIIMTNRGYPRVGLSKNGKNKVWDIHKLIAITFLNHIPNGINDVVDHIDFNKCNNNLNNLRIVKFRYNSSRQRTKVCAEVGVYKKIIVKYYAHIRVNNNLIRLGIFNTELEANNAYEKAKIEFNIKN